ncbi:recombinase family protein [Bradyrhizobium stylosanthis]|uniref:DNA invertase Pin-like site-specific DNA recombinase n=1 Tax=Bradyrhizobium stylosanthis TaxID=1803665 RepID=A0A560ECT8_9BRAD|nr:recombinase family protein [Bradyrhizobium stylosanthis]TWB07191.1 DNA invertase Pin-like site-specific DNA recombinase [Bradyrhizobium stylosanthis]
MANSLVIRKGTNLEKRSRAFRAAQYVRMSTEFQRYSIENQAAAIAAYARQKNLTIVRTYRDDGRSGLTFKGRPGLADLIDDVENDRADFGHVLVYDVSRWGRFQDSDESAHYEFICKQNGVQVAYCAEQFDNDGSLLSSIVKNIKRVMAAEYSRELSVKVHTGQCRIASLGYRVGGPLGYGLRRILVDENENSKGQLSKGQRKALQTDRVRLDHGSLDESTVITWIFEQFVLERKSYSEIRRALNDALIANHNGRLWTDGMIPTILANENYIGNIVYNRTSRRLGQRLIKNPAHTWVRGAASIEPVVDLEMFARAQKLLAERRLEIPEEEMLARLRLTLRRRGKLNSRIINTTLGLNHVSSFVKHFGSLRRAYALIGYATSRDCDWIDSKRHWTYELIRHAGQLAQVLKDDLGLAVESAHGGIGLDVDGQRKITFLAARQLAKRGPNHAPQWKVYRREIRSGLLAILRLNAANDAIEDYLLLPSQLEAGRYVWLSDHSLSHHQAACFRTLEQLAEEVKARLGEAIRAASAKRAPQNKRGKAGRTRTTSARVRH